jgi:hypothetical protein
MRKIGLAAAVVAATATVGVSSASAAPVSLADQLKLNGLSQVCRNLGGTPKLFDLGVNCTYVANLNISRQVLAASTCQILGGDFSLVLGALISAPPVLTGYKCTLSPPTTTL